MLLPGGVVFCDLIEVRWKFPVDFLLEPICELFGDFDIATEVEASHADAMVEV